MQLTAFLCVMLVLTAGWMKLYSSAREIFNGVGEYKNEITHLKEQNETERLAMALDREQFIEFRQNVATLMPDELKKKGLGEEGYPYRSLASTISRGEAEGVRMAIAKTMFERGKTYFRAKQFAKAQHVFRQVVDRYGYTPFVPESYFLLAESHFQMNELEECTGVIQTMVELFPHHELTGFALVRLGRIYEMQNRNEEAVDIYKTVLRSYPQRDVASQAKASLRGIEQ
jgi:tetratricopeptide (TPR) repeat protein